MANTTLTNAREAKQDEFYTQYYDIEREVEAYLDYNPDVFRGKTVLLPCDDPEWSNFTKYFAQNFERLGLKKLISTSYAIERKQERYGVQLSLFETEFETRSPKYDKHKTRSHGKIFVLERDANGDDYIDINDLKWDYLKGDGDFRSKEVTRLRDEADVIVTNPPFSLFREFLAWIVSANKCFLIIGNMNAITFKEIFPLIKANNLWLGESIHSGDREFGIPDNYPITAAGWRIDDKGRKFVRVKGVRWFTNLDHGRRHQPMELMTMEDNLKYSKHKDLKEKHAYVQYDNCDAIEVPYSDAIPSDYDGMMGVPISFLDKHCVEQYDVIGLDDDKPIWRGKGPSLYGKVLYRRIIIRKKR